MFVVFLCNMSYLYVFALYYPKGPRLTKWDKDGMEHDIGVHKRL